MSRRWRNPRVCTKARRREAGAHSDLGKHGTGRGRLSDQQAAAKALEDTQGGCIITHCKIKCTVLIFIVLCTRKVMLQNFDWVAYKIGYVEKLCNNDILKNKSIKF